MRHARQTNEEKHVVEQEQRTRECHLWKNEQIQIRRISFRYDCFGSLQVVGQIPELRVKLHYANNCHKLAHELLKTRRKQDTKAEMLGIKSRCSAATLFYYVVLLQQRNIRGRANAPVDMRFSWLQILAKLWQLCSV